MAVLRSDDDGAVLRVLFGVAAADELDADEGIASVRSAYARLTARVLEPGDIARGRDGARDHGGAWLVAARQLAAELDAEGKQQLLAGAFEIAFADGFVLDEEDRVLATLAAALGMNEHEYRAVVDAQLAAAR